MACVMTHMFLWWAVFAQQDSFPHDIFAVPTIFHKVLPQKAFCCFRQALNVKMIETILAFILSLLVNVVIIVDYLLDHWWCYDIHVVLVAATPLFYFYNCFNALIR